MATDLTGGLPDEREYVFAAQPSDPNMRESVNVWVWDDGVEFGLPRVAIEAVADQWDTHDVQANIAFADGRVLGIFEPGAVHDPLGADGKARVLGAGPLAFELVEPFRRWRMHLDGTAVDTTVRDQIDALRSRGEPAARVDVQVELEMEHVVPPWEQGALREEARHVLEHQEEGALMGGPRFEQLFRATGTVRIGDDVRELRGGGLRIRRQGIRRMARFWGHAWQSTVFPSGRAFGYITYPEREDGKPTYNEGYLFEGDGALIPARVVKAPWLRTVEPAGEDVSVVFETAQGTVTIAAESVMSTFHGMVPEDGVGLVLQQGIVRYTWDGESANGMMERSMPSDRVTFA
jgi:prepilin-type processing-associated H-X9-DG protein